MEERLDKCVILALWNFSRCLALASFIIILQLLTTHEWYGGHSHREKSNKRDRTDGDWKDFLRWWHFSSLLYCDDLFSHTCPCFWQEKDFIPKAKLIKKNKKTTAQRSVVCHETQWKGGAVANKVPIILEWIWTMMRKINCRMSGIGLELAPSPLARKQQ